VKKFFRNILLKTAWLYDILLQNYGAINYVLFLDHPVVASTKASEAFAANKSTDKMECFVKRGSIS